MITLKADVRVSPDALHGTLLQDAVRECVIPQMVSDLARRAIETVHDEGSFMPGLKIFRLPESVPCGYTKLQMTYTFPEVSDMAKLRGEIAALKEERDMLIEAKSRMDVQLERLMDAVNTLTTASSG